MKSIRTNETKMSLSVALTTAIGIGALGVACGPQPDDDTAAAVSELRASTGLEPPPIDDPETSTRPRPPAPTPTKPPPAVQPPAPTKPPLPVGPIPVNPPIEVAPPPVDPPPPTHQVCGRLVRVSSDQLFTALGTLLYGAKIVYDTTKTSAPLAGQVYVCSSTNVAEHKAAIAECRQLPKTAQMACIREVNETVPIGQQCGMQTRQYHSYVDFSPFAEDQGAEDQLFDSDTIWRDTSTGWASFDINYVHTMVSAATMTSTFSNDAATGLANVDLSLKFESNDPTIPCTYWTGCPDIELSDMRVDARLVGLAPTEDRSQIGFDLPEVTFSFEKNLNNVPDWLVDLFYDVEGLIRGRVERTLEGALKKDKTRIAVNKALTGLVKAFASSPVQSFYSAWFENGELVVDYQPVSDHAGAGLSDCLSANVAP